MQPSSSMQPSSYIIRIPEPCHENWDNMDPHAKGKFCNACSKAVFDFSDKTDAEIRDILIHYKDQKVCGHFKTSQLNRPLQLRIDLAKLPRNMSLTKTFTIALFLVFGTFLFSCTDFQGKKIEAIETKTEELVYTSGMIIVPPDTSSKSEPEEVRSPATAHREALMMGDVFIDELPDTTRNELPKTLTGDTVLSELPVMGKIALVALPARDSSDTATISQQRLSWTPPQEMQELKVVPNPGHGEFEIQYGVRERSDTRLLLFDLQGSLLRTLASVNGQSEGVYTIPLNLSSLPDGVYVVSLISNGKHFTRKLILAR